MTITMAQALAAFQEARIAAGMKPESVVFGLYLFRGLMGGGEPLTALTTEQIRSDLARRRREGQSPETLYKLHGLVRRFGAFCVKRGWLEANPADGLETPKKPAAVSRRAATEEEVAALLHAAAQTPQAARDVAVILLLARSGLRRGELAALDLGDVDLDGHWAHVRTSKNGQPRDARFDATTADALRFWLEVRPTNTHCTALFLSERGKRFSGNAVRLLFDRLGAAAGIHVSPHQLRHYFACRWINTGHGGDQALQAQLGHSDARMTAHYAKLNREGLDRAYDTTFGQVRRPTPERAEPAAQGALAGIAATVPSRDELKAAVEQEPNLLALGRLYEVEPHVVRSWLVKYDLVSAYDHYKRTVRKTADGRITAGELAALIWETPNWAELARRLGVDAHTVRFWAERNDLLPVYYLARERKPRGPHNR